MKNKRFICLLLTAALLVGLLPAGASAENADSFVLVAEASGKLVIAPEHIRFAEGDSVRHALAASGHSFVGLDTGMISEIDGVPGNYTRSDETGSYSLDTPASQIGFYRFSEDTDSKPNEGLTALMTAMADYSEKPEDVRSAAREEYDTAYAQFVGIDSASAAVLARQLQDRMSEYEQQQNGPRYAVRFPGCEGYSYRYAVTESGFASRTGLLTVTRDASDTLVVTDGDAAYPVTDDTLAIDWTLAEAPVNGDIPTDLTAPWPSFRGNDANNAVTDAPIPTATPVTTLTLTTGLGDVDRDGAIARADADLIVAHYNETLVLSGEALSAADQNADGAVDLLDANLIYGIVNGKGEAQ